MSSTVKTGVSDYGMKPSPKPSGHVCVNGKVSTADLPSRTTGPNSIDEITYDENASLPKYSGGK